MRRREFLTSLSIGAAITMLGRAAAQQAPAKPARVGMIYVGPRTAAGAPYPKGLRQGLAELGYVEGRNLVIEERWAEGDPDRLPARIAELLAIPVDVLVAPTTQSALVAQRQTKTVPVVILSGDPVAVGLVASLARPGGNLTGMSNLSAEYSRKWLELLKEAVPRLHRVGVLWNPGNPLIAEVQAMRQAARELGLDLAEIPERAGDPGSSLSAVASAGADGLVVTDDAVFNSQGPQLAAVARERRLAMISGHDHHVRDGVLMSYSSDWFSIGRHSASYVDRLLKGAQPAGLPVEQATRFKLVVNLKTAKAIGLEIPPALLARADEVIE